MTRRRPGLAAALVLLALGTGEAAAAQVVALFPTDRLTVADPAQATGRRVALPLPACDADPAGCDETRLLNQLDGFGVDPRIAIRFSAPIALGSVARDGAFVLPLEGEPASAPVGLTRLVWDAASLTLHARPARVLLQGRRHTLVVTSRVVDGDGRPLRSSAAWPGPDGAAGDAAGAGAALGRALDAAGVPRREVVAVASFTTQSVTADLERLRARADQHPGPVIRFGEGGPTVFARGEVTGLELRWQSSADPGTAREPIRLPLALLPATDRVGTLAFGRLRAPQYLSPERHLPHVPTRGGAPAPTGEEDLHVALALPAGPAPAAGWPVAVFGHGFGGERLGGLLTVAGTLARHGFAIVAINVAGHGGGPAGELLVTRDGRETAVLPGGGRGADLDGDGRIGPTEGSGTIARGPLAILSLRDGLRQTVADLMLLVRAIRRGVDVDGDGRADLDGTRVHYVGQSLGGIYGTLLLAVDPHVRVGVLNVPGGSIPEIARLSAVFRPRLLAALGARTPSLVNGDGDFHEFLPLAGEPPVRAPQRGALEIQAYLDRAEWLSNGANPVAFAPYLRRAPLAGVGPKAVLYQMAAGDLTVPNPTTENILRAGDLFPFTSVYRHDRAHGLRERLRDPHGFLSWADLTAEAGAVGLAAQEQVARFFLSGGRRIDRVDDRFEPYPSRPR